jgi:hypothetical protein
MKKITKKFMNEGLKAEVKELLAGEHKDAILAYGSDCALRGVRFGLIAAGVILVIDKFTKPFLKPINEFDSIAASKIAKKIVK